MTYQEDSATRIRRQRTKQAIALAMDGKWRGAVAANQEIVESFPDDVDAYNRLGRAYTELGDYTRAKEAYQRTLELDPYNTIAEKNIRRLSHLGNGAAEVETRKFEPKSFIEEIGKAGVVSLHQLAPPNVLATVAAGDMVNLKVEKRTLVVDNARGDFLGQIDPKHALRLIRLMDGGNRYSAHIINSSDNAVTVIIREVYQDPSQVGQISFPTRMEDARIYGGDRMIKREAVEFEDEFADEAEYGGGGEEGEEMEGFHDVDDKVDTER
jgi:tetratricopeptide (TPR) repeat protein